MEPEARYAWVGVAVLALVALVAGGMYWLTGGTENKLVKRYVVYFEKQSLEGLQIGSDVRMQGIKVGKVEDYAISPGQARRVRAVLQVDARTPVLEGVHAEVARHLVTGLAAIDLVNVEEGGPALLQVPDGEEFPVIPEGVPQFARVASTLEEMSLVGRDALVRFNTLLADRNQKAISDILVNLDGLSGDLRQSLPALREDLHATLATTRKAADQVQGLSTDAGHVLRHVDERLDRVASETESTLASARQTLGAMDREVRGLALQLRLSADLATQEVQTTAQSLRLAGDALRDTGRAMSDPARILYGTNEADLGPGEKP
ncbi:MAG: MCE family protein [Thiobacillus sp.]|nr:MCE family protein [Thiobacillus sp.]